MTRRQLPIGIQDFRTIREQDFYYVDKTSNIQRLINRWRYYFLSRQRRFGKSLLVDTLRSCTKAMNPCAETSTSTTTGDWSVRHPVIRLSFGGKNGNPHNIEGFADRLRSFFSKIPYQWQIGNGPFHNEVWYTGMLYALFPDHRTGSPSGGFFRPRQTDMALFHGGQMFVFEFKMANEDGGQDAAAHKAIEQIEEKGYAEKYRGRGEPIHLIDVAFSRDRNLAKMKVFQA